MTSPFKQLHVDYGRTYLIMNALEKRLIYLNTAHSFQVSINSTNTHIANNKTDMGRKTTEMKNINEREFE